MRKFLARSLLAIVLPVGTALAADEVNVSKGATLAGPGLAAHGYDVVAFFTAGAPTLGSAAFQVAHNGGTYRFANKENLAAFKANPARYEPAFGGYCAYGVALGKKFDGDPRFWKIADGKLYLNLSGDIQAKWLEDVPGNIDKAARNWSRIRDVAVDKL
jgi:YHS domain-containing protein